MSTPERYVIDKTLSLDTIMTAGMPTSLFGGLVNFFYIKNGNLIQTSFIWISELSERVLNDYMGNVAWNQEWTDWLLAEGFISVPYLPTRFGTVLKGYNTDRDTWKLFMVIKFYGPSGGYYGIALQMPQGSTWGRSVMSSGVASTISKVDLNTIIHPYNNKIELCGHIDELEYDKSI